MPQLNSLEAWEGSPSPEIKHAGYVVSVDPARLPQHSSDKTPQTGTSAPGSPHKYQNTTPYRELGRFPDVTDCPVCGQRELTKVKYVSNGITHCVAISMFFMMACCVPYMTKSLKDAKQYCGYCGTLLVTRCLDKNVKVHVHV